MVPEPRPAYLLLWKSGRLEARVEQARNHLEACDLCGRDCRVNRRLSARGAICRTGEQAVVSGYGTHHGEEDPLRGWAGSGTIFFSHCSLRCVYCQNWAISQEGSGSPTEAAALAEMMLELQEWGCHNINLVSPTHVVASILEAVLIAARRGLRLPLVYNTGGYDSLSALGLMDGVVDIYMPDLKYADPGAARRYSLARDYVEVSRAAVREMHRQVGDLVLDSGGLARRGLLVRHLVLPGNLAGTREVLAFIAREISPDTYVNLMDQYRPAGRSCDYPPLDRRLTEAEFEQALSDARSLGLSRLDGRPARPSPPASKVTPQ